MTDLGLLKLKIKRISDGFMGKAQKMVLLLLSVTVFFVSHDHRPPSTIICSH